MYRDAYRLKGIDTHIKTGDDIITSARNAVGEARRNYNSTYSSNHVSMGTQANLPLPNRYLGLSWTLD